MSKNVKQVYDANPSTTIGNNDLIYVGLSPYGLTNDSAIKYGDLFTELALSFVQTLGGVTAGHLPIYGSNGQTIKDCGINVDTNQNIFPNNVSSNFRTTATSGGTTTLTVSDAYNQFFTGSSTHTVVLPVVSTLSLGFSFYIVNTSTQNVTVNSSGGNPVQVMSPNSTVFVTCVSTSGVSAASWYADATGLGTDLFPNGTVVVTNSTQTIANGTVYVADAGGVVTFTLPSSSFGSFFAIAGINGWVLNVGTGITATIGNVTLTGGASATWSSGGVSDTVIFEWIGANVLQAVSWTGLPVTNGGSTPMPLTAGTGITLTRSGGNLSVASPNMLFPNGSVTVTGTTQTIANGTIYLNNPSIVQCNYTLPATAAVNTYFAIQGIEFVNGFKISVGAGQILYIGNTSCTQGNGFFSFPSSSTVIFECTAANTTWHAISIIGNATNDTSQKANALNAPIPFSLGNGGTGTAINSAATNNIPYFSSTSAMGGLISSANSAQLVTSSSGVPSLTASMTNGQVVVGSTGATPVPATLTAGTGVAITNGAGSITVATTGVPLLASNNAFTAQNGITPVGITSSGGAVAWNLNSAPNATHAATENTTLGAATNQIAGNIYTLEFVQNGSAAKTFAFNSNYKFPQGVAPIVSTGLSAVDIFTFYSNGTNMYCIGIAQNIS